MRSTQAAVVLAGSVIAVALIVWLFKSGDQPVVARPKVAEQPTPSVEPIVATPPASAEKIETTETSTAREAAPEPAAPPAAAPAPQECVVFGRTVDESDQPVAGAVVRLCAYKVWADGHDVPRLPGKYDLHGWEVATDSSGAFRFEGPTPTAEITSLTIQPDPFHDSVRLRLGAKDRDARAKLVAGDNDLGVFRLATTGAIRGRVTDENGQGIAGVTLNIGDDRSSTYGRDGETDATGAYTIVSIVPGTYGVNAKLEGRLSQFKKPFDVVARRYTDGVDFTLMPAPSLRGVVVDESGAPIKDVRLWGWPQSSGSGAGATSAADGAFTIYLPQDEPYTLEATAAGFEAYHTNDRSIRYAPGTRDLRVEMKRAELWPMLVVDASNDQPIERFGFRVVLDNSRHAPHHIFTEAHPPSVKDYPGGVAQVDVRPGVDTLLVLAEEYEQETIDLEPGPPPDGKIVVRLRSASAIVGRIVRASTPVRDIAVRLERRSSDSFQGRRDGVNTAITDEQGTFRFNGVEHGRYCILARTSNGEVINRAPFMVRRGENDLGVLELTAGAVISGRVLVPPRRSAAGLTIHLDGARSAETQVSDSSGGFRFEGLAAGAHTLFLDDVPGALAEVEPLEITLSAGETREVELDARERGTCEVALTILFNSKPAIDAVVELDALSRSRRPHAMHRLGNTDENGRVSSWAPASGTARIHVWLNDRRSFTHPSATLDLTLDARIEQTVAFDFGSLTIELPASVELTSDARLNAKLRPAVSSADDQNLSLEVGQTPSVRTWTFTEVMTGDFELSVDVARANAELERVATSDDTFTYRKKPIYSATMPITIRRNETTRVTAP